MKYHHTVQLAIAINARVTDDTGTTVAAFIAPVAIIGLWLPALIWRWCDAALWRVIEAVAYWHQTLTDWQGWREDVRAVGRMVRRLDWREICYD